LLCDDEAEMLYKILMLAVAVLVPAVSVGQNGYPRTRRSTSKANPAPPQAALTPTFEGTLKYLTNKEIVIQMQSEQLLSIRRDRKTKFFENDKEVKPADIAPGTPLAIDVKEDIDLKPIALKVVANPPPPKESK
jgi:hypothetical protein